jgi:hypothetical protein
MNEKLILAVESQAKMRCELRGFEAMTTMKTIGTMRLRTQMNMTRKRGTKTLRSLRTNCRTKTVRCVFRRLTHAMCQTDGMQKTMMVGSPWQKRKKARRTLMQRMMQTWKP